MKTCLFNNEAQSLAVCSCKW